MPRSSRLLSQRVVSAETETWSPLPGRGVVLTTLKRLEYVAEPGRTAQAGTSPGDRRARGMRPALLPPWLRAGKSRGKHEAKDVGGALWRTGRPAWGTYGHGPGAAGHPGGGRGQTRAWKQRTIKDTHAYGTAGPEKGTGSWNTAPSPVRLETPGRGHLSSSSCARWATISPSAEVPAVLAGLAHAPCPLPDHPKYCMNETIAWPFCHYCEALLCSREEGFTPLPQSKHRAILKNVPD